MPRLSWRYYSSAQQAVSGKRRTHMLVVMLPIAHAAEAMNAANRPPPETCQYAMTSYGCYQHQRVILRLCLVAPTLTCHSSLPYMPLAAKAVTTPKTAKIPMRSGMASNCDQAALGDRQYRLKSPMLTDIVDQMPMVDVTACMKAINLALPAGARTLRGISTALTPSLKFTYFAVSI